MQIRFLTILLVSILISCSENSKSENISIEETHNPVHSSIGEIISLETWDKTPAINDRVATEEDVKKGLAVYCNNKGGAEHTFYKAKLPKLAYLTDSETSEEELVVVIQIEVTAKDTVAGYRNLGGGNGACMLYELRFANVDETKK